MNWLASSSLKNLENTINVLEVELKSYKEAPIEPTIVHEAFRAGQDAAFLRVALILEADGKPELALIVRSLEADKFPERLT